MSCTLCFESNVGQSSNNPHPPPPPSPEDISLVFSEKYKHRVTTNHLPSIYTLHVLT